MSETSLPPAPTWTPATPPPPPPQATAGQPRVPFHQRVVRVWWAIGVALACLVVGAGTGSLITHLAERNGSPARFQRDGFGQGFPGGGFGQHFQFRGPNGQFNGPPNGQLNPPNGQTLPNGQAVPPQNPGS